MKFLPALLLLSPLAGLASNPKLPDTVLSTDAYTWHGDTISQMEFKAWAPDSLTIVSTYKGRPGYFMGVDQVWKAQNDLTPYPKLKTPSRLHQAVYNMALDEMINAVEPDTTLRTGKEWAGVWTRDVSYSIILSMAALQPKASMISLMKKVNPEGQIIQDTGSGGAWPISTDRMIWTLAAWEIYKTTGSVDWLKRVYPIVVNSLAKDRETIFSERDLVKGETSFIDWREQSYPKWMQTVDISQSEAMGTNALYAAALQVASEMATILGKKKEAAVYSAQASELREAMEKTFTMPGSGMWGMYTYGGDNPILNPRIETLGSALAILYDVASPLRQEVISEGLPVTPYGAPVFYPQIADMPSYHNNALWPFVASFWGLAQAKAGNEQGVVESIGSVVRPAALFATNKENLNVDNGDFFTELNSSNMLWSLSGNLALTNRILFGINYEKDGLRIRPFVPEAFRGKRTLSDYPYRGAKLEITVEGYGDKVSRLLLDGKEIDPNAVIPASKLKGREHTILAVMASQPIAEKKINRVANLKAPLTPIARMVAEAPLAPGLTANVLEWEPIEYIGKYIILKDGKKIAETRSTRFDLQMPGEYQVIGVSGEGVESFASKPLSNRMAMKIKPEGLHKEMLSDEVSYPAETQVSGYSGDGFAETSMTSGPISVEVEIPEDGIYTLSWLYANGNGPVNTENKAAIRTMTVDGAKAATIVMPTRGVANWDDWGRSNGVVLPLARGLHKVALEYLPEDSNMNLQTNHALIDHLRVEKH